jgi:hypothetical protein
MTRDLEDILIASYQSTIPLVYGVRKYRIAGESELLIIVFVWQLSCHYAEAISGHVWNNDFLLIADISDQCFCLRQIKAWY